MQMTNTLIRKSRTKNVLLAMLITALTPGLQGCTDQEIAAGVAVVAVGAAAVAIGAAANSNRHNDRDWDRRDHGGGWNRGGGWDRGGGGWDRGGRRGGGFGGGHRMSVMGLEAAASAEVTEAKAEVVNASSFADTFSLSVDASSRILSALDSARAGDATKLEELGLDRSELRNIGEFRMPSANAVAKMAHNLDQDNAAVESMLQQLIEIARSKQQELNNNGNGGN